MQRNIGFSLIGYHFLISPEGEIFGGRTFLEEGAHTKHYNSSLGIALIGNFEEEELEQKQIKTLFYLMRYLSENFFLKRYTFHFILSKRTVCGKKIYEKLIKKEKGSKKFFYFPYDFFL